MPSPCKPTRGSASFGPSALCVSWIDLRLAPPPAALAELDGYERDRAARFGPADRRRYEAAHCALRAAIRAFCGASMRSIDFVRGAHGKPSVTPDLQCQFSLSYCGDLAVIALTRQTEIGVDLERIRPIEAVEELAACHFAASETMELLSRPPGAARDEAFLGGWVRKEACVKAVGHGLSVPTNSFVSGIGAEPQSVVMTLPRKTVSLALGTLSDAPPGYIAAWAGVVAAQ